jgi:pimeloyl-ACP methyl ester carboxylesterase
LRDDARVTILHFSHANGFPAACYRKLFGHLERGFEIRYINTIGHDPRHPVTDGWPHLVSELIEHVAAHGEPVLGVGHSLGGYLTLLAALKRPALFRAIVLLDSPILAGWKGTLLGMVKRVGLVDRVTPAGITRDRRAVWASSEEAYAHFRSKRAFRGFDEECLRDYVTLGMRPVPGGVRLAFDPSIEYRIYRAFPHAVAKELPALRIPAGLICGRESADARKMGLAASRGYFRVARVPGGHLFPFEHPEAAAAAIREMAETLTAR